MCLAASPKRAAYWSVPQDRISIGTLTPLDTRTTHFRNARRKQPLPYQQAASLMVHQNPLPGPGFWPM
jgi:hypothetical protein